ncbi:hypothetical protein L484_008127 [Morus notabilis]|uniref:Uncharacterized protein n=1 Tax=Morus notabilis TaxID=981085 RepID=W9QFP5_9ROSA|nr:hypothetical protein L484_008127 [Morus notabilis]
MLWPVIASAAAGSMGKAALARDSRGLWPQQDGESGSYSCRIRNFKKMNLHAIWPVAASSHRWHLGIPIMAIGPLQRGAAAVSTEATVRPLLSPRGLSTLRVCSTMGCDLEFFWYSTGPIGLVN